MRAIMTRAELVAHKATSSGRDYSRSDDGYGDMEVASSEGWHAISGWGQDGWDLGDWPYVVISTRDHSTSFQMRQTVEGDTDVYYFDSTEERNAAIDYLFIWYGIGHEYDKWQAAGLTSREALDAGTLRVPEEFRGPFSWSRVDLTKSA